MFIDFWHTHTHTEAEHERGRRRKRERPRIPSRLQALSCQHRASRGARIHELWDHDLSQSPTFNWLSHPGISVFSAFICYMETGSRRKTCQYIFSTISWFFKLYCKTLSDSNFIHLPNTCFKRLLRRWRQNPGVPTQGKLWSDSVNGGQHFGSTHILPQWLLVP